MQVQVGCFRLTQAMSLKILVASSDSCMAEFVKELHFEPRAVLEGDSAIVNASRNAWKRPFNFLVHSVKAQRTHKSVVEAIRRLKSVSSVRICFTSMGDPTRAILRKTLPLIHSTLQCYAENLTLLAITVPLVEVPNLLPPFLIFPRLRTLSLFLYRRLKAPHDSVGNILATSVLPFISSHTQTLETLRIVEYTGFDFTPLFKGMRRMPNLKTLHFSLTEQTEGYHIRDFIRRHSDVLRDIKILTLDFTASGLTNSFDSIARLLSEIQTPVPGLQRLDIWFGDHPGSLSNPEPFSQLAFSSKNLATLKLIHQQLDFATISSLLLSDTNRFQRLRTLVIEVSDFYPMVLDILAELANLHNLKLQARWFQTNGRNFAVGVNDHERHRQASVS